MISAVGQTTFTYTFPIIEGREADLEVTVDGVIQTLTTDYSVTGAGNASGGTIIFVVALVGGEEVVIRRVSQFTQATVYTETGAFPAASHEAALDKLTMITQELKEVDERSLKWAPKVDKTVVSSELPDPTDNAGKGMFFSTTGVVAQTVSSTDISNPMITKGQLLGFTTVPAAKTVGADKTIVVADSTDAFGWDWTTQAASLYTAIAPTRGDLMVTNATTVVPLALIGTDEYYGSDGADVVGVRLPWAQGQCRLQYTTSTSITLVPYNGDTVILKTGTDWGVHQIPTAGVSLGIGTVSALTKYYIYLYNNGGTLTLQAIDITVTQPALDTDTGFLVKSSDATKLLVGLVYMSAGPIYRDSITDRHVRSWFNDPGFVTQADYASGGRFTASTTYVEVNTEIRCSAMVWAAETLQWSLNSYVGINALASDSYSALGIDSTTVATYGQIFKTALTIAVFPAHQHYTWEAPADALHIFHHLAKNPAADTVTFNASAGVEVTTQQVIGTGRK